MRTLLSTIKGYSELLIEDMEADDLHPLRSDLTRLNESADRLLARIDTLSP